MYLYNVSVAVVQSFLAMNSCAYKCLEHLYYKYKSYNLDKANSIIISYQRVEKKIYVFSA